MSGARGRRRPAQRQAHARYLPMAHAALALSLLVALFPSALRPPADPANTAAEFSPDAPPDPSQDAIVAALNRGSTSTAGDTGSAESPVPGAPPPPPGPLVEAAPPPPPRFCPQGVGDPPRQVESWYSAPCAGSWQGDNGGATYQGVSANEVRVVIGGYYNGDVYQPASERGEIPTEPRRDQAGREAASDRTSRVLIEYLNQNYQFWGRRLRVYFDYPDSSGSAAEQEAAARAMVVRADEEYDAFLVHADIGASLEEAARRQMVGYSGMMIHPKAEYYTRHQPYVLGWAMDGHRLMQFAAEYVCKKLAGKPAAHAGGGQQGQPRKFGFIHTDGSQWGDNGFGTLPDLVDEQCGEEMVVQSYGSSSDESQYATAITKLRAEGVTSVVTATDPIIISTFLSQADAQSYFPEWINTGMWLTDRNYIPTEFGYSRTQWSNAFGFAVNSMTRPKQSTDWYRAYKSIDPDNEPHYKSGFYFPLLMQIANGIQMAGPNLTPETFRAALFGMAMRHDDGTGLVGGGYGPGHLTFTDDVSEVWWDPVPVDPSGIGDAPGQPGVWRYVRCGQRYQLGEIPREDPLVFQDGCITPDG